MVRRARPLPPIEAGIREIPQDFFENFFFAFVHSRKTWEGGAGTEAKHYGTQRKVASLPPWTLVQRVYATSF